MAEKKNPQAYELAFLLYMAGVSQKEAAQRAGVSAVTVNKWAKSNSWEERRAGATVTRTELINKVLKSIGQLLDANLKDPDASLADKLAKLASTITSLDKKNNVVNDIDTFMNFNKYLQERLTFDKSVDVPLVRTINKLQDDYVTQRLAK